MMNTETRSHPANSPQLKRRPSISSSLMESSNRRDDNQPQHYDHESQVVPSSANQATSFFGDQQISSYLADPSSFDIAPNDARKRSRTDLAIETDEELAKRLKSEVNREFDDSATMLYVQNSYLFTNVYS